MKASFRNNPLLVVSITLPVLVLLLFAGATAIPKLYTDPPSYDLLLAVDHWDTGRRVPFKVVLGVEGDRVTARVARMGEYEQGYLPRLFRYNHDSGSVREITIPHPPNADTIKPGDLIDIPELQDVQVSPELTAPDGYEFRGRSSHRGLMGELFGGSRTGRRLSMAKNGAVVRIRLPQSGNWHYGAHFLGWITSEPGGG